MKFTINKYNETRTAITILCVTCNKCIYLFDYKKNIHIV